MTLGSIETTARSDSSGHMRAGRLAWVDRCCASIVEREPLLAPDDVLDLASTLWGLPRCEGLLPEFAAGLLLGEQLCRIG